MAPSLVGLGRLELPTSRLSGVRSNQLSYRPSFSYIKELFAALSKPNNKSNHKDTIAKYLVLQNINFDLKVLQPEL